MKSGSIVKLLLKYLAEIIIIFLGITISFVFDQWREERRKERDLIELSQSLVRDIGDLKERLGNDRRGSITWIGKLDSLRIQRPTGRISNKQLVWFYEIVTGQNYFLFEPHSPTYLSAANSSLYHELPDDIKSDLYNLYEVRLRFFQLLYDQQQENITHFRSNIFVPAAVYLYDENASQLAPDLKILGKEILRPAYGNLINQMAIMEKEVYKLNEASFDALTSLEEKLETFIKKLKES